MRVPVISVAYTGTKILCRSCSVREKRGSCDFVFSWSSWLENYGMPCQDAWEAKQGEWFLETEELRWVLGVLYSERLHESNDPWELPNTLNKRRRCAVRDAGSQGLGLQLQSSLLRLWVVGGADDAALIHLCLAMVVTGAVWWVSLWGGEELPIIADW